MPLTPAMAPGCSGVSRGRRRRPLSREGWPRGPARRSSRWDGRWQASCPRPCGPSSPASGQGGGTRSGACPRTGKPWRRTWGPPRGCVWAMSARGARRCGIVGGLGRPSGAPTRRMRPGTRRAAGLRILTCNTPPAWGQERLAAVVNARRRQGRGVVADEACGGHPSVRDGVAGLGLWDVADGPQTTRVWGERPAPHVPSGRGRGRRPPRDRVRDGAPEADPGLAVAAARPAAAGTRQTLNAGRQGPMVAACAARRVSAGRDPRPGPEVWVGRRRHPETGALQTARCQAPLDLALTTRGPMCGRRGPIDTCGEDSTHRLGLGDAAVRGWAGGPHPLTVVRWAHGLVVRMRRRLNKTPPR